MNNIGWISDLKLRGGYGEIGNQDPLGNFPTDVNLEPNIFYVLGNQEVQGISQTNLANPNITWETTATLSLGVDAGLFENRLLVVFDWYKRNTKDLIWQQQVPNSVGLGPASVNAGEIENKGIELALTWRDAEGDFQWDISGNMTTVQNTVVSLVNEDLEIFAPNPVDDISGHQRTYVGQSIGQFYGFVSDGIFRNWDEVYNWAYINQANTGETDPNGVPIMDPTQRDANTATGRTAPGDIKWVDTNGDGIVNADDRVDLGSPIPVLVYGLTFNARWKGFDLQFFVQG
jgi:outer membrane receptor protein involved in Fe transport